MSIAALLLPVLLSSSAVPPATTHERVIEWSIKSHKQYVDPFNDVDVDVVFDKDGHSWRVPTFWRGGQQWTVRFAPPLPGEYTYHLESTDAGNPDLNGHAGKVTFFPYTGKSNLLSHGMVQVSADKRHFAYQDGVPFYWLGDTWWTGLSSRLSWDGFKELTADRKAKGFTVVQIVAGLIPDEELAPVDPGYRNEGGAVWDPDFKQINPKYFDYADRRILYLLNQGLTPAIVGAWSTVLEHTSVAVLKKHWRYVIARYGAYPVIWILGGAVVDPPEEIAKSIPESLHFLFERGWTDIARYVRATDPYHHPLTAHETSPPFDFPVQDESLLDFDMFQSGHYGWASIAVEVAQIDTHYARIGVTKPVVEGEVGYERLGEIHLEDFQRTAFWLSMLNGAAGHTYGAVGVWEAYTAEAPLHRLRHSFLTWPEGMRLPGAYQVGLSAKLLRKYPWWRFEPHPDWVSPGGTTLLAPRKEINGFDIGRSVLQRDWNDENSVVEAYETDYPGGEWKARNGNFRLPYAAGIPREVRFIYVPTQLIYSPSPAPTVLGLEIGVRYHAYFWEPTSGTSVDLGIIERPEPEAELFVDSSVDSPSRWTGRTGSLKTLEGFDQTDAVASVGAQSVASAGLVLRYHDGDNYIAAIYSPEEKSIYILNRQKGGDHILGKTAVSQLDAHMKLSVEVRGDKAAGSVNDGRVTYRTPIVDVTNTTTGSAGILHPRQGSPQRYEGFELRRSPTLVRDVSLKRHIYDAQGQYRGNMAGPGFTAGSFKQPGWDDFGRDKHILLDAYRPEKLPTSGDWLLVLDVKDARR